MKLRNILIINDCCFINGGQAKVAISSAIGLAQSDLNVVFFAGQGPPDPSLAAAGVQVICLDQHDILSDPSRLRALARGIWNPEAARRLRQLLDAFSPQDTIVHCHGFAKVLSGSIGPVITRHAIPHVFTMHEYFLACPNGGFFHYPDNAICTRRALGPACLTTNCDPRRASHKAWRVARQVALNTAGNMPRSLKNVIYISQTQLRAMNTYMPESLALHYLPNPIDTIEAPPVDVASNDIFLFIGRLSREKGAAMFAQAARIANVSAVFVGDGEERQNILAELPGAVITGWQPPAQVSQWINRARCVVFSSLWYECQPLVPYEAAARGVPIITGAWNAASEVVSHDRTGLVVETSTCNDFALAMRTMDGPAARRMGTEALKKYWANPLTLDRHCRSLTELYNSLLN